MSQSILDRIGVCSWSLQPAGPAGLVADLESLGIKRLQLALDPLREHEAEWASLPERLAAAGVSLASAQFGAIGEDYSSPQTIRQSGGFIPTAHWPNNLKNIEANLKIAQRLGITTVSTHAGFIPQDADDPMFEVLVERIRVIADLIGEHLSGQLLLETGQETSATLNRFLQAVDRKNLGVNFDPANMLLYNMGDPLGAIRELLPYVRQVHIKDAVPPAEAGVWGEEVPVGTGAVDWPAFLRILTSAEYSGDYIIEREAGDQRVADIATAREVLQATLNN
ncbi:MAG: sugar phosphate isomerase/epimerase family protein [Planctomycetota bacterium]